MGDIEKNGNLEYIWNISIKIKTSNMRLNVEIFSFDVTENCSVPVFFK